MLKFLSGLVRWIGVISVGIFVFLMVPVEFFAIAQGVIALIALYLLVFSELIPSIKWFLAEKEKFN